jgi:hypothetical protein
MYLDVDCVKKCSLRGKDRRWRQGSGSPASAARMNTLLKLSVIVSLLLASSGVGFYYAVYLPRRDAQLENERRQEKAQADAQKRVAQERSLAERKKAEQRQAETKASAEAHYQTCLNKANMTHESSWAAECKRLAEKALADHSECLTKPKLPKGYCDAAYGLRDASPGCVLPQKVATGLDGDLSEARNRCQRERRAALQ